MTRTLFRLVITALVVFAVAYILIGFGIITADLFGISILWGIVIVAVVGSALKGMINIINE